ncbi:MAG TPA: TGS domain-containing protein [Firmicutes bacterium]|nr:TGS domain-containing protein [Bacillota bacterium]
MPANLTPQYLAAEQAFKQAKTIEEKIAALEEMLAVIPKHKGTEKLQADIKTRLSKLRDESERRTKAGRVDPFLVPKEGAGQVVLLGFPNVGKSALVGALTRARVVVADYPFSTSLPVAGMMPYEDILIQLVDMPPVTSDGMAPGQAGTMRNADVILIVVDAGSDDCLDQLDGCLRLMRERRVLLEEAIEGVRGVTIDRCLVAANKVDIQPSTVTSVSGAAASGGLKLPGPETWSNLQGLEDPVGSSLQNLEVLREFAPKGLEIVPVSSKTGYNLDLLRRQIFDALNVIRIYSKVPGKDPDMDAPFVLRKGSTVVDMARAVHRDFPNRLKYARIWGSARFDGQSVPRDYVLQDKDVVELHLS